MGRQDCMQPRHGCMIAVREEEEPSSDGDSPGYAETRRVYGVKGRGVLVWQNISNMCGIL